MKKNSVLEEKKLKVVQPFKAIQICLKEDF